MTDSITSVESETVNPPIVEELTMADMLEEYLSFQHPERGETVSGEVVRITPNFVIVDINAKSEGIVPADDLQRLNQEDREAITVGADVLVQVVTLEDDRGNIVLSMSRAQRARDWLEAQQRLEDQEICEYEVTDCNKGGVLVRVGHIRGFVPGSQLDSAHVANDTQGGHSNEDRWASVVGETLRMKVIEVDQHRNRLILSEKAATREWRRSQRDKLLKELVEGEVRHGRVVNLADFGAFVDLGGVDGLVHLSELSWKRVGHPREVVEIGQEVDVYVIDIDRERQRIALSIKRLLPDPWVSVDERYQEGQLVEAKITRLMKWGAFASIVDDEAIEGLIHISEISEQRIAHPREVVQPSQTVTVRVIEVDGDNHRLALSLKQVDSDAFLEQDWGAMLETDVDETPTATALSAALSESGHDLDTNPVTAEG